MSSQTAVPGGSAPAQAHLSWDGGPGYEVLVGVEVAVSALTAALEDGEVVSFPLADGATVLLNGAQLAAVVVSPSQSGSAAEKHIGM